MIRTLATALATSVCLVAMATPAAAQTKQFNISAGSLKSALDAFARQSGRQIIYRADQVRNVQSPGVRGAMSADAALRALLAGTGFAVRTDSSGAQAVVKLGNESGASTERGAEQSAAIRSEAEPVNDIIVTGTRLKADANGFPVNSYSREQIDESGQSNLSGYLSTLNEVSISAPSAGVYSQNSNSTVQLRGLPIGTTLTLLNGRRLQSFGSSSGALVFDINSIPFEAIERVDVIPVGSSAVYGGDALAGVVNIVLKRSIEGVSIGGNYSFGKGTDDKSLSLATGHRFENGSILLVGSVGKTSPLTTAERGFFRDADYRRFGGSDARVDTCLPGTVSSDTGANLPGLASPVAGIPNNESGARRSVSEFAATDGAPNLCGDLGTGYGSSLVNGSERYALHASAEYQAADWLTLFAEGTYNHERVEMFFSPITLYDVLVPAANAFNPFGVDVRVTGQIGVANGYSARTRTTEFKRFLIGGRGQLATGWEYEVSAMTARDSSSGTDHGNLLDAGARAAALASGDPATSLNLFTTGRVASDQILRSIWGDAPARVGGGRRDQVNGFVRGEFPGLPAGSVQVVLGGELSRDSWKTAGTGFGYDTKRSSRAGFAEANIPLLNRGDGGRLASLSVAGRWDSFNDFGDAKTYQTGLELAPAANLHIRGATSTSFKPPSLLQMNPSPATYTTELFGLRDPMRGNEPIVGGTVIIGPSASLAPETGRAATLGFVWEPTFAPRLRLGVTAWRVNIKNLVTLLFPQTALDYEEFFPSLVTREPAAEGVPGRVTRVDLQYVNFGYIRAAGLDFEASYSQPLPIATLELSASATRTTKYKTQLTPGAAVEDRLNTRATDFWAPKWKARAGAQLNGEGWSFGVTGRYLGRYRDAAASPVTLGDRWVYDLSARLDILKRAQLTASIVNVGNQMPEYSPSSYSSYDFTQGDWRGRTFNLRLSTRF